MIADGVDLLFGMKKLILLLSLILTGCGCAIGQTKYSTYTNNRYAYQIEYPLGLLIPSKVEDASNSGEIFYSKNKEVEMRVWGEYNALFKTWREECDFELKDLGAAATYTVLKPGWFVISGVKDGKIFYQKTLLRKLKEIDVFYTFTIEYPPAERAKFDAVVERIAKSFKFDPTADV